MYQKTTGLQATIRYLDGLGSGSLEKIVTNPQVGDRAQATTFGAQIFAGDGTQTIIPWGNVIGSINTEFFDVYLKMDQESEEYVLCPLDEVEQAIVAVAAQEAAAAVLEQQQEVPVDATSEESESQQVLELPTLEVVNTPEFD